MHSACIVPRTSHGRSVAAYPIWNLSQTVYTRSVYALVATEFMSDDILCSNVVVLGEGSYYENHIVNHCFAAVACYCAASPQYEQHIYHRAAILRLPSTAAVVLRRQITKVDCA